MSSLKLNNFNFITVADTLTVNIYIFKKIKKVLIH